MLLNFIYLVFVYKNGDTPLHIAARQGHVLTVICLLQNGADPTMTNIVCIYINIVKAIAIII